MIHAQLEPDTNTRPLILVVDDIPANRFIVQRRLERMNYDCIVADGGRSAIQMIQARKPALVLLDFMMPGIDGLTVLRELRMDPETAKLPVIMLTARTDAEAVVSALKMGADDYVHKPIDFTVLKARIESHLRRGVETRDLIETNDRLDGHAASRAMELVEVREMLHREMDRVHQLESRLAEGGGDATERMLVADGLRRIVELCNQVGHSEMSVAIACVEEVERIALAALRKCDSGYVPGGQVA